MYENVEKEESISSLYDFLFKHQHFWEVSEWGIYTFWVGKWPHNRGKISYHMWYWPFRFLAQPIFQLRYWAVSPLQRPKNDDPTRVKGENKCKSTGWTVKSRPHQIVKFQTFFILVLIKCYNSFLILVSFICPSGTFGCEAFIYTYFPLNVLLCLWLPKSFVNADQNSPRILLPSAYIILTDWVKMMLIRILQEFLCHQLISF